VNRAQTWVVRKMTAWHEGPYGGQCPRTEAGEQECSQYGIAAVQRRGAVAGVLEAARYTATCRPVARKPDDPLPDCRFGPPNPDRWAFMMLLPALVGLHLREALPKPQPGSCPFLVTLFLFARIGLFYNTPDPRWSDVAHVLCPDRGRK
jgi:hypothetical protein